VLDDIWFENTSGGLLPTAISEFVTYYPIPVNFNFFRVSLTRNGPPIDSWESPGHGWAIAHDPERRIDMAIDEAQSRIDQCLTAHELPIKRDALGKYPIELVGMNARMAARQAVATLQFENEYFRTAVDRLTASEASDREMLTAWRNGLPINPRPVDSDTIPDNAPRAESNDPVPWRNNTL